MNIEKIMEEIDVLYSQQKVEEVEALLVEKIEVLKQEKEVYPSIALTNELLGIYREKGDSTKGIACCQSLFDLFSLHKLPEDEHFGTTLLNIATAYRAFGRYEESHQYYKQCASIYEKTVDSHDYRYASLYNNMSLLSSEMGNFSESIAYIEKSLDILAHHNGVEVQIATANTSLAQIYMQEKNLPLAQKHIGISLSLFSHHPDYHYSATLATAGDIAFLSKDYEKSASLYQQAMDEIEKYLGKTENYRVLEENLNFVKDVIAKEKSTPAKPHVKGLELSQSFYEDHGKSMISSHFTAYETQIAVGLVGEGSECFGYDDVFSTDHDFGVGFCMWLPDALFEQIGSQLKEEYEKLPTEYQGVHRTSLRDSHRVGVFSISGFYESLFGMPHAPVTDTEWAFTPEHQLAQACNGKVFRDDLGQFTAVRNQILAHYPLEVLGKKLAEKAHLVSQTGQYNLQRTLKRGDTVTASLILSDFSRHTMEMLCLLHRTYAPFYKWTYKKLQELPNCSPFATKIAQITSLSLSDPQLCSVIEDIVSEIIALLHKQGFITQIQDGNFLDHYVQEIASLTCKTDTLLSEKKKLVDEIVALEWNTFDQVDGLDGRATCQDDYETFQIMRSSQFHVWSMELLRSYHTDFQGALAAKRNMISEKYGFMMKSTDFTYFQEIESLLPPLTSVQSALIEDIIAIQLKFMLDLQPKYPNFVSSGRSLRTSDDSTFNTSYETYLRGELSTYSNRTLRLYGDMLAEHVATNDNTAQLYMTEVAKQYGYPDIASAEAQLSTQ